MQEDQEKQRSDNMDDQDDFGLPEVNYSPIEREDDTPPVFEPPAYYSDEDEEEEFESKKGWVIAGVIGFFILIGLAVYLFLFDGVDQLASLFEGKQPVATEVVKKEPPVVVEPKAEVEEPAPAPEETTPAVNPLAPYRGIDIVSKPTGRSYIIIASFVDEDMAYDFSQSMLDKGVGVKMIQPTRQSPLQHRVAVADYGSFREAMREVPRFRAEYGDKAWVLKF